MTRHPVVLPISDARCPSTRMVPCSVANDCARALVDGVGRYVQDYSIEPRGPGNACPHYIDAASHRPPPAPVGPKVHEALQLRRAV